MKKEKDMLEKHKKLLVKLDNAVKENFGYCDETAHSIIDMLIELEAIMTEASIEFVAYHDRDLK